MLNRIYIVVGLLAILVLAAAFVMPRFIQWSDYRERMQVLASEVLGAEVTIMGEIEFALLPQPRLWFSEVVVGDLEAPVASVAEVEAEFALIEFLRDHYDLTRLVLREPVIDLTIEEGGAFAEGVSIAPEAAIANVTLRQAMVVEGRLRLADRRSGENLVVEGLEGELRLASLSGPFQFQGAGRNAEGRVQVRLNASARDGEGNSRLSAYFQQSGVYSISTEGLLTPGPAPHFEGTLVYRQVPPPAVAADQIRGELVVESRVQASTERIVLSGYSLLPDENRPGTGLTGSASVTLGAARSFDAVVTGGIFALPPRDATEDQSRQPYELVRLLRELPAPPLPPVPGRVGIELAEMNLRGFSLRDVRVEAETDTREWQVLQLIARMPGETEIRASGRLTAEGGRPGFTGDVSASAMRLDALVQLWRRPVEDNPLFNVPAAYRARAILGSDALGFTDGTLTLNGTAHRAGLRIGFGEEARLDVTGRFGALSPADSRALAAMVPDMFAGPTFPVSFPEGSFSLRAASARIAGLDGTDLVADGDWGPDGIGFDRLAAGDLGGAELDLALALSGTLAEPAVSGGGTVAIAAAGDPALALLYDTLDVPEAWRAWLAPSLPARFSAELGRPEADGAQELRLDGVAGVASVDMALRLAGGLPNPDRPLSLRLFLEADDADALTRQVGLGEAPVFSQGAPVFVSASLSGVPSAGLDARLNASAGTESIGYAGSLAFAESLRGAGTLEAELDDAGGLATLAGARATALPPLRASAVFSFTGDRQMQLTGIEGISGGTGFSGELTAVRTGTASEVTGALELESVSVEAVGAALLGRLGMLQLGDGPWPDGPLEIAPTPSATRGTIAVSAPVVTLGGRDWLADSGFEFAWDGTRLRLGNLSGRLGAGVLEADFALCCAGALADKTVTGRATLDSVPLEDMLPPELAGTLSGTLDGGLRFEGSGPDLAAILAGMAGEGSFSIADLRVENLDPAVYGTVAGLEDVLEMDPDALRSLISLALGLGPFRADAASSPFTVAGGTARVTNLSIEGEGARLSGGLSFALDTLGIDGAFTMTPRGFEDETGMIVEDTARIVSRFSGDPWTLTRVLDIDTMVAAIQVRANEIEVERLEALRLEDEARRREAAEERNRLIREQMRQRAEAEAARNAPLEAPPPEQPPAPAPQPSQPATPPPQPQVLDLSSPPPSGQPFFMPLN